MENGKNIYARVTEIKKELNTRTISKSGKNAYAGFNYYELKDLLPHINELNEKHGVDDTIIFNRVERTMTLRLTNTDDKEDYKDTVVPYEEAEMLGKGGAKSNVDAIQRNGATITYSRRYAYITAYNINENDMVDAQDNTGSKVDDTQFKADAKQMILNAKTTVEVKEKIINSILKHEKADTWKDLKVTNGGEFIRLVTKTIDNEISKEKERENLPT